MGKYDKKPNAPRGGGNAPLGSKADLESNPEFTKIARWLSSVKFRKKAVGGLDPVDVWKKIEELNTMYENAILAERVRCNMVIRQMRLNSETADFAPEDLDV